MPMKVHSSDAWLDNFLGYPPGLLDHIYFSPMDIPTNPSTEPLLPDDIWKKFELDFPEFTAISDLFDESLNNFDPTMYSNSHRPNGVCHIRNHDCMWAGHCASKEHPTDEPRPGLSGITRLIPQPPVVAYPPYPQMTMIKPNSNPKSLLKPAVRAANQLLHTPQTPPMSDDEEVKVKQPTTVLQMLNQAINECDLEEDSDLCEYFEEDVDLDEEERHPEEDDDEEDEEEDEEEEEDEDEDEEEEEMKKRNIRLKFAAESDHSYHKGKHPSMNVQSLGIDTPSDSEEEIDVVSVAEKFQQAAANGLPNRPSNRDRHHIQRRVATAIHNNRNTDTINSPNQIYSIPGTSTGGVAIGYCSKNASSTPTTSCGIKTLLPVRKPSNQDRNKQLYGGGVKRQKHHHSKQKQKQNSSAHKRKHYSSDSEPEPSEKRSMHNNMERQRRVDLRNAFEDLRKLVPEVSKKERAAKVVILREASKYCHHLTDNSDMQNKEEEELKRQQKWLRKRVSQLRRSLANKR